MMTSTAIDFLALTGALLVLFLVGRLYFRQSYLIFRPSPELARSPADLGLTYENLHLNLVGGGTVHGWWIPGPEKAKVVIYFHGSDGNLTHELPTLRFLHSLGVNVLLFDYPGYGKSGGRPNERGCYRAADAAWSFVHEVKGFAPESIILYGHSLGSAVSIYLATQRPCGGLVVQSGFTSVPDLAARSYPYLPVRYFCHTKMDSLRRIAGCDCPLLIFHSESDEEIPVTHAQKLYAHALDPKLFVRLRGLHADRMWQHAPEVRRAWQELLLGRTGHWGASEEKQAIPSPGALA